MFSHAILLLSLTTYNQKGHIKMAFISIKKFLSFSHTLSSPLFSHFTHIMLTKGLASCIVLDLIPTPENRELAKKTMEKSCFQVVYTGNEQDNPLNICKSLVEKNPHKFKAYPDTPPPSPQLAPTPAPSQSPPLLVRQPERAAVLVGGGGGGNNNLDCSKLHE